jgi:hypothetical protein
VAVEFGVHAPAVPAEPSGFTVIGRVMQGSVRVWDVFTEAEGPRLAWTEPSSTVAPVQLRVVEARVFRRLVDEVEEMFSAELLLDGEGRDALTDLVMLRHHGR